ncbi:HDOD domain-containing protein [Zoogloea sp.]|uniref:HDOD domain-containing protein n=1 Tax=Zoogloea sp. TaxID=49181 RepID=UPI0035B42A07
MNTATANRPLTHAELNETLSAVRIPPCPGVVAEVMREAQRDEPSLKVLSRIIASDVGMSAAAVKLANSPMFSAGTRVRSVQQAVSRLGINHILSVVVAVALRNTSSHLPAELMERFWSRASTLALAAGVLARGHVGISPDSAYTFALFQDAAVPVLMSTFPDYAMLYARLQDNGHALILQEQEEFRCDHAVAGWLLARSWGLSDKIATAIRYHHDPEAYILPEKALPSDALALIAVSVIAEHVLGDYTGDAHAVADQPFENAKTFLGVSDAEVDELHETIAAALI